MHLDDRKLKNTRFCNATFTFVQGVTTKGVSSPRTASNNRNVKQKTTLNDSLRAGSLAQIRGKFGGGTAIQRA